MTTFWNRHTCKPYGFAIGQKLRRLLEKKTRSLPVSAGRRMAGCHPMANGHGSNEPETTRTEPKGTGANRKTCKPTRGNDGGRLAGAVENRRNSNETHPEKRNSRMTDAPGGEPGSVILANSRKRVGFATTPPEWQQGACGPNYQSLEVGKRNPSRSPLNSSSMHLRMGIAFSSRVAWSFAFWG